MLRPKKELERERIPSPLNYIPGPFRFSAREIGAALALATGDRDGAADRLKLLTDDPETPLGIRQRAAELLRAVEGS